MTQAAKPAIWIEVDDLIRYFDGSVTPTGISRVQKEILGHLAADHPGRVRLFRAGADAQDLRTLSLAQLESLTSAGRDGLSAAAPARALRWLRRRGAERLRRLLPQDVAGRPDLRPGDVVLNLGASWSHPHFARTLAALKQRNGVRLALLFHDILPVTHPDLVEQRGIAPFAAWLHGVAPLLDLALAPSRATADSLKWFLAECGYAVPPVAPVPFGAGFGPASQPAGPPRGPHAPVVYVSTIEIRKNHMLLLDVWERLLAAHGPARIPPLVFAGKPGWGVSDLQRRLRQTRYLDGKIRVVSSLPDAQLSQLYRDALFTVFPSFCEGWGLPVAESLAHGRACIASSATSIPEVGGTFADYHDPRDPDAATTLIERAVLDRTWLEERSRAIRQDYPRPSWRDSAAAIIAAVDGILG